jgi:hypothetical protein
VSIHDSDRGLPVSIDQLTDAEGEILAQIGVSLETVVRFGLEWEKRILPGLREVFARAERPGAGEMVHAWHSSGRPNPSHGYRLYQHTCGNVEEIDSTRGRPDDEWCVGCEENGTPGSWQPLYRRTDSYPNPGRPACGRTVRVGFDLEISVEGDKVVFAAEHLGGRIGMVERDEFLAALAEELANDGYHLTAVGPSGANNAAPVEGRPR